NEVKDYLSKQEYSWEVIISDDGSTDGTGQISDKITKNWDNFIVQKNPHGGKPAALLYGLKAANGELVLFSDMDQSTPISELEKLLPFANEYDVVIGSRGVNRKNFPVYRKLGSFIFASIRKSFVLSHIDDTQCGFKL